MKVLDLFSGIGGFSIGLERAGMQTMAFCEIDPFCRKVLNRHWPGIPIFEDIRSLSADDLPARPDLICGGYPCQPFSVAGKQRGKDDDRHLWPEMFRLVKDCRPAWVIGENVAGHVRLGLDEVLSDLESEGYACQPFVIPACAVDAPHRRDRVWIVAHTDHARFQATWPEQQTAGTEQPGSMGHAEHYGSPTTKIAGESSKTGNRPQERSQPALEPKRAGRSGNHEVVADACSPRVQVGIPESKQWQERVAEKPDNCGDRPAGGEITSHWSTEPDVGRVVDGVPDRVDRIKALGNTLVPGIPELFGRAILAVT